MQKYKFNWEMCLNKIVSLTIYNFSSSLNRLQAVYQMPETWLNLFSRYFAVKVMFQFSDR